MKKDKKIAISVGTSKTEKIWRNEEILWSEFVNKLKKPVYTKETLDEYSKMTKDEKSKVKDVGGFVGGYLIDGKRRSVNVKYRSIVTLDVDNADKEFLETVEQRFNSTLIVYSTHSHTKEKPRFRLIIPLSRDASTEEYEPLARKIAEEFGLQYFDTTTFQAERLMFWPSCSKDAEYIFKYYEYEEVDVDEYLSKYEEWQNCSRWQIDVRESKQHLRNAKKHKDPLEKKGIIGFFCRTYTITEVINKFLSDIYIPTEMPDRFTYTKGSTIAGLVVYEDKIAHSYHSTDPICGKSVNAFDLLRIHRYGHLDDNVNENTPTNKMPSFIAMNEFIENDEDLSGRSKKELLVSYTALDEKEEGDLDWTKKLDITRTGKILPTGDNIKIILMNDSNIKDSLKFDCFRQRICIQKDLPWRKLEYAGETWRDGDNHSLKLYLEKKYKLLKWEKVNTAFTHVMNTVRFHPVRDYLDALVWDGRERLDTLLVDYLGTKDTHYSRLVIRKMLVAAVARIYQPGIKFDMMIITIGKQGIGKSTLPAKLAGEWFSDSLENVNDKKSYEAIQGTWIMEMSELDVVKKAEETTLKKFLSKTEDKYRLAYRKDVEYFPRQCIFWGTTNEDIILRDQTGARRFLPIRVGTEEFKKYPWHLTQEYINQVWAEAIYMYKKGEKLILTYEETKLAEEHQTAHTETSHLEGQIREYLEIPLPEDWYNKPIYERRNYIQDYKKTQKTDNSLKKRNKVCVLEIWYEMLKKESVELTNHKRKEIRTIISKIPGWMKGDSSSSQSRFGDNYGKQVAFYRKQNGL